MSLARNYGKVKMRLYSEGDSDNKAYGNLFPVNMGAFLFYNTMAVPLNQEIKLWLGVREICLAPRLIILHRALCWVNHILCEDTQGSFARHNNHKSK